MIRFLSSVIIADMQLRINGQARALPDGLTVAALIERLDVGRRRIAVEVNREVIPRAEHAAMRLAEGDEVEIVHAIGGG